MIANYDLDVSMREVQLWRVKVKIQADSVLDSLKRRRESGVQV